MKKLLASILSLTMALVMLAGVASASSGGAEIVINLGSEPPEMNSVLTTSTGSMNVLRHIMEGLTMLDQNDAPIPAAAESWDYDEATLTYTFHIRQNQKWSNGEPVTAHDFVFAWTKFFTPATAAEYASTWAPLILGAYEMFSSKTDADVSAKLSELGYTDIGFKAVDDYTLQVTTAFPCAYFLDVMAFPSFMPVNQKACDEIGFDAYGKEVENLVTNGAYRLTSWAHQSNMVLEKNPEYWDAANIKVDKITMEMISDSGTALNSFVAGDLDMIGLNAVQTDQMIAQGREPAYYDDGSNWYFQFNHLQPGLNNTKIRKALTLAIDVQAFIDNIVRNGSQVAFSFTPPAISGGEFAEKVVALNLYPRPADGDYSEIKALFEEGLAEEGLTAADLKLSILTDEGDTARNNSAFFQEQWKQHLGVDVEINQVTYQARLDLMNQKQFYIVMAGWGPDYNDPMTFLDLWLSDGGNNETSYANPAYDALIAQALVEPDFDKRDELLIEVEKIIAEDYPVGPIYFRGRSYITSDRLSGVVRTAFQDFNMRWCSVSE